MIIAILARIVSSIGHFLSSLTHQDDESRSLLFSQHKFLFNIIQIALHVSFYASENSGLIGGFVCDSERFGGKNCQNVWMGEL